MAGGPQIIVEYIAETAKLVAGMKAAGDATAGAASATKQVDWKNVAKWSGAAIAVGAGVKFLHGAAEATTELAKNTIALQRSTNLDTRTASEWVSMLQSRNIETGTFQTALGRLSKQMETARTKSNDAALKIRTIGDEMAAVRAKGGKDMPADLAKLNTELERTQAAATKARAPFAALGVNFKTLKAGNISEVILQAADAISKMESPTRRAAAAQALFGKAGLKLLPILMQGRKGIQDNLDTVEKYGASLGDKQVAQVKKVANAQRQLALAHKGVQVAIGSALLPAQAELYGSLLRIVQAVLPFTSNINVMKGVLIAGAAAFGIYKAAVIATAIAEAASSPALIAFGAALWASIGPIALVVAGIAALIAIGYLLYRNWDSIAALAGTVWGAIKAAAMDAFNWLRSNWPLLLGILAGPIGLAVVLILRHWATIKAGIVAALNAIKNVVTSVWNAIVSFLHGIGSALVAAVRTAWNAVRAAVAAALNSIRSVVTAGFNAVANVTRAAWNTVVAIIRGAVGKAGAAARAVVTAIKAAFAGAGTWLVNAGRQIVMGLVHGIEGAAGAAIGAAENLAHRVIGALGKVAKIFSPSRVTYEQGWQIAQGLANGITAGTPAAEKAAREMAQKTMDAAQATLKTRAASLKDVLSQAFQAQQGAVRTPAEQQLAALQAAHDEAGRAQALADAQAQLSAAQSDEERLSAQRAVNDALYAIQVAGLTARAEAERTALDQRQKDEQRAFDASLTALTTYLANAHATAAGARKKINALMLKYGLDFAGIASNLGNSFATGLEKTIGAVTKAANKLASAVREALRDGLKIGSPSKVAMGYGRDVGRGLALGIERSSGLVNNALRLAMPSTTALVSPLVQASGGPISVRVFIGDTELRGMVQAEIVNDNTRVARRLLAGVR